jgi:hypothetical protein
MHVAALTIALVGSSFAARADNKLVAFPPPASGCYDDYEVVAMNDQGDVVGFSRGDRASWTGPDSSGFIPGCPTGDFGTFLYSKGTTQIITNAYNVFGIDNRGALYGGFIPDDPSQIIPYPARKNRDGTYTAIPAVTDSWGRQIGPAQVTRDGRYMIGWIYNPDFTISVALWQLQTDKDAYTLTVFNQPLPNGETSFTVGPTASGQSGALSINERGQYLVVASGDSGVHSYIYQLQNGVPTLVADLGLNNVATALNNVGDATGYSVPPGAGAYYAVQIFIYHHGSSSNGAFESLTVPSACATLYQGYSGNPIPFAIGDDGTVAGAVCGLNYQSGYQSPWFVGDVWVRTPNGKFGTVGSGLGTVFLPPPSGFGYDSDYSWWNMNGYGGGLMNNRGDIAGVGFAVDAGATGFGFASTWQGWIYRAGNN